MMDEDRTDGEETFQNVRERWSKVFGHELHERLRVSSECEEIGLLILVFRSVKEFFI